MAYQVEWSPRAVEDVEAVALYISVDSTAYAAAVVKKTLDTTRNLSRFLWPVALCRNSTMKIFERSLPIAIESFIGFKGRLLQSRQ